MKYRITRHLQEQAGNKKIPMPVINAILEGKSEIFFPQVWSHDKCKCGFPKTCLSGIMKWENVRYAVSVIVCDTCGVAITTHKMAEAGCTPLRADQPNVKKYERECADCGRNFVVTARTWEKLHEQTNHKCKHGKWVDLIADEDRNEKGRYYPKAGK
ncbi:hypothetical protein EBT31_14000 [bacterium]|nr:hypothetical protein [bacterium]